MIELTEQQRQELNEDVPRAIDDFTTAIRLDPRYHDAYYNRALALRRSGNPDAAIRDYTEAIRLDPNDPDPFLGRSNALADKHDFAAALLDNEHAIQMRPGWPLAYFDRASLLLALERVAPRQAAEEDQQQRDGQDYRPEVEDRPDEQREGDDNESRYSLFGWSQPKSLSEAIQSGAPALFQPMNALSVFSLRLLPRPNQDGMIMAGISES